MESNSSSIKQFKNQIFPIFLTILTFFAFSFALYAYIIFLDHLPVNKQKVLPHLQWQDILVGLTIYLKTAIDFAIFIGNLMHSYPGWKNRISLEIGTSLGNFIGTLFILTIWDFFKEIPLLLTVMIFLATLVLLGMAEEGLSDFFKEYVSLAIFLAKPLQTLFWTLTHVNKIIYPLIHFILPRTTISNKQNSSFLNFFFFVTIPLVLGLDDFAGYIPLFTIVNVFGFAVGVFLGHMLLTASLFAAPSMTTRIVRSPIVLLLGSLAFIGIAAWGFYEVFQNLLHLIV